MRTYIIDRQSSLILAFLLAASGLWGICLKLRLAAQKRQIDPASTINSWFLKLLLQHKVIKLEMATGCLSLCGRRKSRSKQKRKRDNLTLSLEVREPMSPASETKNCTRLELSLPGTVFTFDNFNVMANCSFFQRNTLKKMEPGSPSPRILLPIIVVFLDQSHESEQ